MSVSNQCVCSNLQLLSLDVSILPLVQEPVTCGQYLQSVCDQLSVLLPTVPVISTADDWPKVLSLRTLLVRSVQHLVTYTKMFVFMSSFGIRLMTLSLMSTNGVTALEPYIPFIKDYQNFAYSWHISLHLFLISSHN